MEQLISFKGTVQCDGAAEYALGEKANWYVQERKYKENGLSSEEKLVRRQENIKPSFDAFKEWVETQHENILTKRAIGRAMHYAINQLPLIEPFFEDGRIHLEIMPFRTRYHLWRCGGKTSYLQVPTRCKEDCYNVFLFCFLKGGRC
jgi:hypothetical protein